MKLRNIRIQTQLVIGFSLMFALVLILGAVSYFQYNQLHQQTESMYHHPLQVRRAIASLDAGILEARAAYVELIARPGSDRQAALQKASLADDSIRRQFDILQESYLGPDNDVESARRQYIAWKGMLDTQMQQAQSGSAAALAETLAEGSAFNVLGRQLEEQLGHISTYSRNEADALYSRSVAIRNDIGIQASVLIVFILVLFMILSLSLLRSIRRPLGELVNVAQRFGNGDMSARSSYGYQNEFGELSASFNAMVDSIETNIRMDEKTALINRVMLQANEPGEFFREVLAVLNAQTGAQMSAVYLLGEDRRTFEHVESVGLDGLARQAFDAEHAEGEFGAVLRTRQTQLIRSIPDSARFRFNTVSGHFLPREIISIPILSGGDVIAIISLASIASFQPTAMTLISSVVETMNARIEGILANRKIKAYSLVMEQQNRELDMQKNELIAQKSELVQQNVELEMQKNQLAEASRLKNSFLSNMSHELRTPLNSIIALSGILKRKLSRQIPDEEHSYLEIIERNGKNLLVLINNILDLSRIEAGHEEVTNVAFDLDKLIAEVVQTIRPLAAQKGIGLRHEPAVDGMDIVSDADKCRHIFENLLGNAVKFTDSGEIVISGRSDGARVEVSVRDTGIGIEPEHISHIFEEFRQADGSTARKHGGSGLGLTIARKYANLMGGDISVTSAPGQGADFRVILPLAPRSMKAHIQAGGPVHAPLSEGSTGPEPVSQSSEEPLPESRQALARALEQSVRQRTHADIVATDGGKTLLLVEDSEPAVIQIRDLLESSGYRTLVARNAIEALAAIEMVIPDAMVLDLMMPEIDGFDLLRILRNAEPTAHIPVLVLTAKHITKDDLRFLKRNNVHQLIQKGDVNREELIVAVQSMLKTSTPAAELPVRQPAPVVQPDVSGAHSPAPPEPARPIRERPVVLVVEDNPDNLVTVRALLADRFTIIEAEDGRTGILKARTEKPDLIVMDIRLPDINGSEAFRQIRMQPGLQSVPVIALTASVMVQDRDDIMMHGFDAFVPKPILEDELFKTIDGVLYGR